MTRRQFCPRGHDTFVVGRDSSYRCLECKREASAAARKAREDEASAARFAELKRQQAAADRRRKREHARMLKAGGDTAAEARWQELWDRSPGLCQWPLENGQPGACTRRTDDVYCARHNRRLEREIETEDPVQ
jgi:hypothetical protein